MTDYTKSTGTSGTMMVRDTGTRIEFWLRASALTYNYQLPWSGTINNTLLGAREFRFEQGGQWQMLGAWTVSTSQTVVFHLSNTGVSGLGGPTEIRVAIKRATVPSAPARPVASSISASAVRLTWTKPADNGAVIDGLRLGYRRATSGGPTSVMSSDLDDVWAGFTPGETVYFCCGARNSEGWGPWSAFTTVKFLDEPAAGGLVTYSEVSQLSVVVHFADPANNGGTAILERQVGWTTTNGGNPTTTATYSATGVNKIANLRPGTVYYFRSRTRNAVGWSAWSGQTSVKTIAGAFVKVGGVWKDAIPYVKYQGVWRPARPWVRLFGFWEESS
jgi:hypothetical protein